MPAGTTPIFIAVINDKGVTWVNADGAAASKDVFVAGSNGSRCFAIAATSTDTSDRDFQIFLNDGSTSFLVGTVTVPLGAGNTGTVAALNLIGSLSTNPWLNSDGSVMLPTGWKIKASNVTTITTAKTVTLVALGGDY